MRANTFAAETADLKVLCQYKDLESEAFVVPEAQNAADGADLDFLSTVVKSTRRANTAETSDLYGLAYNGTMAHCSAYCLRLIFHLCHALTLVQYGTRLLTSVVGPGFSACGVCQELRSECVVLKTTLLTSQVQTPPTM